MNMLEKPSKVTNRCISMPLSPKIIQTHAYVLSSNETSTFSLSTTEDDQEFYE